MRNRLKIIDIKIKIIDIKEEISDYLSYVKDGDNPFVNDFKIYYIEYFELKEIDYVNHLCIRICIDILKGDNFYENQNFSVEYGGRDRLIKLCNLYKRFKKLKRLI